MNKVAKGYRVEKRCADELEAEGYTVWKTMRVKFADIDLWHIFDVVALNADGDHIRFIQCKTNRCDRQTREKIRALKMPKDCRKELWIWVDREGWTKEYL
jgi:hypothetical protein